MASQRDELRPIARAGYHEKITNHAGSGLLAYVHARGDLPCREALRNQDQKFLLSGRDVASPAASWRAHISRRGSRTRGWRVDLLGILPPSPGAPCGPR